MSINGKELPKAALPPFLPSLPHEMYLSLFLCSGGFMKSSIRLLITAGILLVLALCIGDRYWATICLVALVFQVLIEPQATTTIAGIAPCFLWLVVFRVNGNRELFFPFSAYLAAYTSLLLANRILLLGVFGGGTVLGAFAGIRAMQSATKDILGVELTVAGAIMTLVLAAYSSSPRNSAARIVISILASLLAYAALAI